MHFFERLLFGILSLYILVFCCTCVQESTEPVEKSLIIIDQWFQGPAIETLPPSQLNNKGVTFNAKVLNIHPISIKKLGFIIIELERNNNELWIPLSVDSTVTEFSFRLSTDLEAGRKYGIYAFLESEFATFKGEVFTFTSLGSEPPIIEDFNPKEGPDGTKVYMKGKNFPIFPYNNFLNLDGYPAKILQQQSDLIIFEIPETPIKGDVYINYQIGAQSVSSLTPFFNHYPEIYSISTDDFYFFQKVSIEGDFRVSLEKETRLKFSNEYIHANISEITADKIEFYVSTLLPNISMWGFTDKITIQSGAKVFLWDHDLKVNTQWQELNAYPFPYRSHQYVYFVHEDKVYFLDLKQSLLYMYRNDWGYWSPISTYPGEKHEGGHAIVFGDSVLKFGGPPSAIDQRMNEWWIYNITTNTWQEKDPLPFSFHWISSIVYQNEIYLITELGEFYRFDLYDESFTKMKDLPFGNMGSDFFFFSIYDEIFILRPGKTYQYLPIDDLWVFVADNPFGYDGHEFIKSGMQNEKSAWFFYNGLFLYKFEPSTRKWIYKSIYMNFSGNEDLACMLLENRPLLLSTASFYPNGNSLYWYLLEE